MEQYCESHAITQSLERLFYEHGKKLTQSFILQTFLPALELVEQRLCCCVCDPISAESYRLNKGANQQIVFKPLQTPIDYRIALITPTQKPSSLITRQFYELIQLMLGELSKTKPSD